METALARTHFENLTIEQVKERIEAYQENLKECNKLLAANPNDLDAFGKQLELSEELDTLQQIHFQLIKNN